MVVEREGRPDACALHDREAGCINRRAIVKVSMAMGREA